MSMQLWNEVQEAKQLCAKQQAELDALRKEHAQTAAQLAAVLEERRAAATELRKITEKVASLWALKDSIAADAKEFLGRRREAIDPTKVKMPETLRRLGYTDAPR